MSVKRLIVSQGKCHPEGSTATEGAALIERRFFAALRMTWWAPFQMRGCAALRMTVTICLLIAAECLFGAETSDDPAKLRSTVTAPANTRELGNALGGAYYVDKTLLDRYEALKARLAQAREEITSGNVTSEAAMKSLAAIQSELEQLRKDLDQKKVLVSAFKVYSKKSEDTFPMGGEGLVIVTADDVTIRGWKGPGIKCVVEKIILAKEPPQASEFDAIRVKHELRIAEEKVGRTLKEREREEKAFLESTDGRKMTDEQKAIRKRFVDQIHHSYDDYIDFQGRKSNTIELVGLTYQEGNRNLSVEIKSAESGGSLSSEWQRHAKMTVYVPTCKALAVRGCQVGLDISGVEGDLLLTTADSRDRDYEGSFVVKGVKGNVTIDQAPVRVLSDIAGNIRFTATNEFVNSGTMNSNDTRTFSNYETHATQIDRVGGDVRAEFLRTDLKLTAIKGVLDVVNSFGSTHLTVDRVDRKRTHRIVSESGTISIEGKRSILQKTPIYAYTECGRLHTNLKQDVLEESAFSTGRPQMGWNSFVTPSKERFDMAKFERPAAVLEDRERSPGLDLISHAGTVSILTNDRK
jgi:hypothetical protein